MPFKKLSFLNISRITVVFAAVALFISLVSLAGWLFNFANLTTFIPGLGWTGMKANTTIGFLLACTSLILPATNYQKRLKIALAVIVLLLGTITIAEYIFHWNAQIDELFFKEKIVPAGLYPGRMIPLAAVGFIFLGTALLLLSATKNKFRKLAELSAIIILAISFIGLAGYIYNVSSLYKNKGFTNATIPASLAFLLLSLAVLFSTPQAGLIAAFTEKTKAAKMGTLQIVSIISILLVIGWLTLQGYEAGFYDTQFGISIMIAVFIVSFFFVIEYSIEALNKSEMEKEKLYRQNEKNSILIKEVFERVNDPFIALDNNWDFTYVNKKAAELARRTPEELIGKNIWKEFPEALNSSTYEFYTRAMAEQSYMATTGYFAPLNLWHESFIYPSPEGLSVYVRDITEKKIAEEAIRKSEKKFRDLLEATPDAMVIVNEKGQILMTNQQTENIFGYTKDELYNQQVEILMPAGFRHNHEEQRKTYVANPKVRSMGKSFDLTAKRKDGEVFPVEISLSPLVTEEGMFISAAIRDITERKKAAESLEESYQSIRKLTEHLQNIREEERTSIAREIHDELGQQLTVMMMDVSWLDKKVGVQNEAVRKKIKELLLLMENTVKTVRRISTQLRPSVLDDLGLLVAMDLQLKEFSKRSGICTNLIVPKTEPLLSETVKNGLFRIFQESLTNVARHSGAKNVRVLFEKEDGKIVLTIEDNGTGFDEGKAAAKKTLGVLGMKERAAVMGGEYLISGESGKGTVIVVRVPVKEKESYPLN